MVDVMITAAGPSTTKEELDTSVAMLRAMVDLTSSTPDMRLHQVLEMTVQGYDPRTIAQRVGLTRTELADAIKGIGRRFRSRSDEDPEMNGTVLFPLEPDPDVIANLPKKRREEAMERAAQLRSENPLPQSWQVEFPEVGIRKSVAAIRGKTEVDQNLQSLALRVLASQTPPPSGLLTFASMRATWLTIQSGEFPRIARDPELPLRTAQTLLAAYDALETARDDSVTAMRRLHSGPSADELDTLAVRARPLAEAAVLRLEQILTNTKRRDDLATFKQRGLQLFLNETGGIRLPAHVGELNEGQVHRIGLMLGLHTDPISDRALAAAEERLTELGLADDIPWIKGIWISAFSCKREDDFWEAIERLTEGDTDWVQPLM